MVENEKSAMDRITERRELEAQLAGVLCSLSSPRLSNEHGVGMAYAEARTRMESFINYRGNGSVAAIPEKYQREFSVLKDQFEQAKQKYHTVREERNGLIAERDRLQATINFLVCSAGLQEVKEQKKKLKLAESVVSSISRAIEEQRAIIQANPSPCIDELYKRRQDLLADAATGKNVAGKIGDLEKEIRETEQQREQCAKLIQEAEEIICGLIRKHDEAELVAKDLNADLRELVVSYLKGELEAAIGEYIETAELLAGKYRRVSALDKLIVTASSGREDTIISSEYVCFSIPDARRKHAHLFDPQNEDSFSWVTMERDRQTISGVPL